MQPNSRLLKTAFHEIAGLGIEYCSHSDCRDNFGNPSLNSSLMSSSKIQSIYTDGACTGNPGPGGWGVVVCYADGSTHELGGGDSQTTNNRMEMQAAVAALEFLTSASQDEPITLYTDSEYLKNGITQWIKGWKKKGWKTSTGKPVLNQDIWEVLDKLNCRQVNWQHVRGHSGNFYNDRCDTIARAYAAGKPASLQQMPVKQVISSAATNGGDTIARAYAADQPASVQQMPVKQVISSAATNDLGNKTIQSSSVPSDLSTSDVAMTDSTAPFAADSTETHLPSEFRVSQLRDLVETLRIADEIAEKRYLITSSELADLMDVNASAVTSRGDNWVWRNWIVSRVRREGNQILWQLERVD